MSVVRSGIEHAKKVSYGEVWVVFDRDEHLSWDDEIALAKKHKHKLAISNPCFEVWAVMLHRDQTAWIHRHDAQRDLAALHPSYRHDKHPYLVLDACVGHFEAARVRCEQNVTRHTAAVGSEYDNPSSTFHALVDRLYALKLA